MIQCDMDLVVPAQNQAKTEHIKYQESCHYPSNVESHGVTFDCVYSHRIYTVIRSNTGLSFETMGNQYVLLSPYKGKSSREEIDEFEFSPGPLHDAVCSIRDSGLQVHTGSWLVEGNPFVVLFDTASISHKIDYYKQKLFEKTKIGIPDSDEESNDSVLFGFMVAQFIAEFSYFQSVFRADSSKIVCHFHDWLSGVGLIMLRLWKIKVATVFTAHATLLGHYLCPGRAEFLKNLSILFNAEIEAEKRQIYHKYCLERAATQMAHVFTTASNKAAMEADCLLKRKPDIITPNNLEIKRFSGRHEFQNLHAINKGKILDFVHGDFFGDLDFDVTENLYFLIAGKSEFGKKGTDIESLTRLIALRYYKRARLLALRAVYLETITDSEKGFQHVKQPRPFSEPQPPGHETPTFLHSQDEIDNEKELEELEHRASKINL
ncbi:glycogen [starch] synthase-like [Artemia franciscana]|uniref:glycogen [starch] synthase-like n=1 Tax=Artemia franciscana TaxID=6661 RepID=UPI0032DBCF70